MLWPTYVKNQLIGKDLDVEKDWGQKKKQAAEDEMVGWHRWCNGHEFEQTPGSSGGKRSLVSHNHGVAKSRTRPSDWTTPRHPGTGGGRRNSPCAGISMWPLGAAYFPYGFPVVILGGYGLFINGSFFRVIWEIFYSLEPWQSHWNKFQTGNDFHYGKFT